MDEAAPSAALQDGMQRLPKIAAMEHNDSVVSAVLANQAIMEQPQATVARFMAEAIQSTGDV